MSFKIQANRGPQLNHYYKLLMVVSNTQTSHKTTLLNILEKNLDDKSEDTLHLN
jgi:hypothetical protein